MLVSSRRAFLGGLFSSLVAAPAIVRIENIMPVRLFMLPAFGFGSFQVPEGWRYQWATVTEGANAVQEMEDKYGWTRVPAVRYNKKFEISGSDIEMKMSNGVNVLMERPKDYIYQPPRYTQANLDALEQSHRFRDGVTTTHSLDFSHQEDRPWTRPIKILRELRTKEGQI